MHNAVGATTITDHQYDLDPAGNRTVLDEFVSGITTGTSDHFGYSYDGLERLTATDTTNPETFSLDAASNISSRTGPTASFSYDTANRLTSDGTNTFTWSNADRLTSRGSDSFTYDPLDRMLSSTVATVGRTYTYNGDGMLQSRADASSGTTFLWDPSSAPSPLLQVNSDRLIYGLGPLYVVRADGSTSSLVRDAPGSVRAEVSQSGTVTASFRYRAYGAISQSNGASMPTYLGYAGQLLDSSGLYYLRARWYDASAGRFLTRDPLVGPADEPTALNGYAYGDASPIVMSDPTGMAVTLDDPTLGACSGRKGTCGGYGPLSFLWNEDASKQLVDDLRQALNKVPGVAGLAEIGGKTPEERRRFDNMIGMATIGMGGIGAGGSAAEELASLRFTADQDALIQLAKTAKRTGVTPGEANILKRWANELGVVFRGPERHLTRDVDFLHIHIGPIDHIPVR